MLIEKKKVLQFSVILDNSEKSFDVIHTYKYESVRFSNDTWVLISK